MKNNPSTLHHKIPDSFGGRIVKENTVYLRQNVHRALHMIFSNDTPIQRIRRSLEADKSTLSREVYEALSKTLSEFEGIIEVDVYNPVCINRNKFLYANGNLTENSGGNNGSNHNTTKW